MAGAETPKVAFRVDASARIGAGHLSRCLSLAGALRAAGVAVAFATRSDSGAPGEWIRAQGHAYLPMPAAPEALPEDAEPQSRWLGLPWDRDARETAETLADFAPHLLVADSYGLDARWEEAIRPAVDRIAVIDDTADRPHACDLLLDQNLHREMATRYTGLVPGHCRLLLGPAFALLRPEFGAARASLGAREGGLGSILVCFGGSDPGGETAKALAGLDGSRYRNLPVTIVAGAFNPHFGDLKELAAGRPGWTLLRHVDHMARLMADAGLAIGAGGSSTWERCCLGLPALVTVLAENQAGASRAVAAAGAHRELGKAGDLGAKDYARALDALDAGDMRAMSRAGMALVDGRGCERAAEGLLELVGGKRGVP